MSSRIGSRFAMILPLLGLAWLLALSEHAQAQITGCNVTGTIAFSDYDLVGQSAVATTGDLDVECTGSGSGAMNDVTVDLGVLGGSCSTRTMSSGANTLQYNVYTAANHAVVWCAPTTQFHSFVFGASPQTHRFTMYGLVPASQTVAWGLYGDTLPVSLTWSGGSANGSVSITQNAPPVCSLSADSLDFGNYTGVTADASASLSITCSLNAPYSVSLGEGDHLSTTRRLAGPSSSYLGYALYSDSGRSVLWGDGETLGEAVDGTGSGSAQSLTVYGRIPGSALPAPGSYSDTVVVTLTY